MSFTPAVDVTAWYRFDKEHAVFNFNHLEDGHSADASPQDRQLGKRWKGGGWEKRVGALVPGGLMGAPRLVLAEAPPKLAAGLDD
jgi:hypothetical protein